MNVGQLLGGVPKECRGKYASHSRTQEDYHDLFPLLTTEEVFNLTDQVSKTSPGSYQRIKAVEHYSNINYSRQSLTEPL
jgi:hypothetical protein